MECASRTFCNSVEVLPKRGERGKMHGGEKREVCGFTLIETLIVLLIIGVLVGAMLLLAGFAGDKAQAKRVLSEMNAMRLAGILYYADRGAWPIWAYSEANKGYRNLAPDGCGVLPNAYLDRLPVNKRYWIGLMYGKDNSNRTRAFIILYDQGLNKRTKEILAEMAKGMGFFAKANQSKIFEDLHVFTSKDNNIIWFLTGY